jgi:hypothetical protein
VSDAGRSFDIPDDLRAAIWANDVEVYRDVEYVTLDFIQWEPADSRTGVLAARVVVPSSCILALQSDLGGLE